MDKPQIHTAIGVEVLTIQIVRIFEHPEKKMFLKPHNIFFFRLHLPGDSIWIKTSQTYTVTDFENYPHRYPN